jgi:hypothetical protein
MDNPARPNRKTYMLATTLLFVVCLSAATDSTQLAATPRGILASPTDTTAPASFGDSTTPTRPGVSVARQKPNMYLTTIPSAFWLNPGIGFSSNLGDGESVKRTGEEKPCGFMSLGCDGYEYQRQDHKGFGGMAQAQIGGSNRHFGLTAQLQWVYFDGLMLLGVMLGLPMGQLF